jgi:hypothetical protein
LSPASAAVTACAGVAGSGDEFPKSKIARARTHHVVHVVVVVVVHRSCVVNVVRSLGTHRLRLFDVFGATWICNKEVSMSHSNSMSIQIQVQCQFKFNVNSNSIAIAISLCSAMQHRKRRNADKFVESGKGKLDRVIGWGIVIVTLTGACRVRVSCALALALLRHLRKAKSETLICPRHRPSSRPFAITHPPITRTHSAATSLAAPPAAVALRRHSAQRRTGRTRALCGAGDEQRSHVLASECDDGDEQRHAVRRVCGAARLARRERRFESAAVLDDACAVRFARRHR